MNVFQNHYLDFQLRGNYKVALPFYLREENYSKIKANINQLKLKKGYLTDIKEENLFEKANLSNIFEYMNEDLFKVQAYHLENIMSKNSKIVYWNLLVPRKLSRVNSLFNERETLGDDLCFFYQSFNLSELK